MTLAAFTFDTLTHGTTATTGNTGANLLSATSGTITADDGMSFTGQAGLKFVSSSGTAAAAYGRWFFPAATNSGRMSVGFTLPAVAPSATMALISFNGTDTSQLMAIVWTATGQLIWRKAQSSNAVQTIIADTGVLSLGQRVRIEVTSFTMAATGGAATIKLYQENTTTQIGSTTVITGQALSDTPVAYVNVGLAGTVTGSNTAGIDNLRLEDTAGSELGPYWPTATTASKPERLNSNAGAWTNQGGAASFVTALIDSSDTTYLQSPGTANGEVFVVRVAELVAGDQQWTFRLAGASSGGTVKVELMQADNTIIATRTFTTTGTPTDYVMTLSTGENSAITNRKGMTLRFTSNPV